MINGDLEMKSLEVQQGTMFYEERGSGVPLILLHAGVADHRMWDGTFERFANQFRVARCDLRGFGRSLLPDGPFAYHEDILSLLGFLELPSAWLIGVSFGGRVAIDCCLTYPERVRGLILVSPSVGGNQPSAEILQFNEDEDALLEEGKLDEATELNLRMWMDGPQRTSADVDAVVRTAVAEMLRIALAQPTPENVSVRQLEPRAIARLHEIQVPALIIAGALDIRAVVELSVTLEKGISGAKRVIVPDTAHVVTMEAPQLFEQLALEFILANETAEKV